MAAFYRKAANIQMDSRPPNRFFSEPWYQKVMRKPPILNFIQLMAIDELEWSIDSSGGLWVMDGVREDIGRAKARFDILRLNIANRILELRGREKATRASELVPEFFSEEFVHPDTGAVYEWNAEEGVFDYEGEE